MFGLLLRPVSGKPAFAFWFAVGGYTSYPLLLEGRTDAPILLPYQSNIWLFNRIVGDPWGSLASWQTNVMYYLWWAGLLIIAWVSLPRRHRRYALLVLPLVPLISCAASYAGFLADDNILPGVWS